MNSVQDLTLAGLVHDLKNVFETIQEAADLLHTDPQWRQIAAAVQRSVEQGRRISASFQESVRTFDLEAIVENAVQCSRDFLLASHHPELIFICRMEPKMRVAGRPGAWERVLVNLFINAAHAMPHGGEIEIRARYRDGGVELVVSDSGPGIPHDLLDRVFVPGFSTSRGHTGMGLAIVKSIVETHGGMVSVCNRTVGSGASFAIWVPELQTAVGGQNYTLPPESVAALRIDENA
jgi:signal transduction histidine kinase